MRRILLAVDAASADLTEDDRVLAAALEARGCAVRPVRWGTEVAPGAVVVIRSTWDYVERPEEFRRWLARLDARAAQVVNPTDTLRWNMHKRYLLDLERRGVPIVPTVLLEPGDGRSLDDIRAAAGWGDVVVKPAIAGTARATVHSGVIGVGAADAHLAALVAQEDALVQPVVDSIRDRGEVSVLAIAGEPRAAVVKVAADGEWRVQSDFGGTARSTALTDDLDAIARRSLAAITPTPVYARVDVVWTTSGWAVMELELVEPELFFRLHPVLADELADHLVRLVG